jgi:hypothetical protein
LIEGSENHAMNLIDGCAISVPMHEEDAAPAGLMLAAPAGRDHRLLQVAAAVERILAVGWSGGTMASHYTRSADRHRLAMEAMHKLANDDRTSIPAVCAEN